MASFPTLAGGRKQAEKEEKPSFHILGSLIKRFIYINYDYKTCYDIMQDNDRKRTFFNEKGAVI
jgi:hypothetical protein